MKTITSIESNKNFSSEVQAWQLKDMTGETVTIHGSVYKIRKMHGFAFVLLRSGGEILQCVYEETRADFPLEKLTEECCIKAVVFVSSARSNASINVIREIGYAVNMNKPIVPLMLDEAPYAKSIRLDLSDIDQIDFRNPLAASKKLITSLMYILKMLARTNSSLRRFQIGIQTEQDGVKKIHWNPTIYNVCENAVVACAVTNGDVALDKNFMPIYGARQTPIQMIKQIIDTEKIMR